MVLIITMDLEKIFNDYYLKLAERLPNLITGLVVIVAAVIIGKMIYRIVDRLTERQWRDNILSGFLAQGLKWFIYLFGIVSALNIIGFTGIASTLFAGAGVSAIVFGFAFKDIGENFLAGIMLALKSPFEIGDIIEIAGDKGTVRDLDLRMTHLRNAEGKDIYVPNSTIVKNTLINYTKDGFLRINFTVGIAPECDIDKTRHLILDYLDTNTEVLKNPSFAVVVQDLGEFTTDIQVLFWVDILAIKNLPDVYLGNNVRSKVITDVKAVLDANGIEMPSQVLEHKMYRQSKLSFEQEPQG